MKRNLLSLIFSGIAISAAAQTQISNGGFENWGNASPGNADEPTGWYSNKTGTSVASIGPQTCFKETSNPHTGASCVRIETKYYILAVVNGSVTTGVVNAPNTNKAEGYIGTTKHNTPSDQRRMTFVGRPDSLVGWYKYTQATSGAGAAAEKGKVRAILHTGDYFDPETPVSGNHIDLSANKIGTADFYTEASNTTTWKRFAVPFVYANGTTPTHIMINITPSENQVTTAPGSSGTGSILWIDDLQAIYNPSNASLETVAQNDFNVYSFDRTLYIDLKEKNDNSATLTVFDLAGKAVFTQKMLSNEMNEVSMPANLVQGTYLYDISGTEIQKTGKFVIK